MLLLLLLMCIATCPGTSATAASDQQQHELARLRSENKQLAADNLMLRGVLAAVKGSRGFEEDSDDDDEEDNHEDEERPVEQNVACVVDGTCNSLGHRIILHAKSQFQDIAVKEDSAGKIYMQLNGETQNHEDEATLSHFMMVDVPLMLKGGDAQSLLILGGGDGLPARHALQHPSLQEIVMVELDGELVRLHQTNDVLRRLTADSLNSHRVDIRIEDAFSYLQQLGSQIKFDIVLNDIEIDHTKQSISRRGRAEAFGVLFTGAGACDIYVSSDFYPSFIEDSSWSHHAQFASLVASYAAVQQRAKEAGEGAVPLFELSPRTVRYLHRHFDRHLRSTVDWATLKQAHPLAALYFACVDFTRVRGFEGAEDSFGIELYFYLSLKGPLDPATFQQRQRNGTMQTAESRQLVIHQYDMG
jgi:hypothetical protein